MEVPLAKIIEDKKFMWDGKIYETEEEANKVGDEYKKNNFEVRVVPAKEGKYLVYSRRVVKEIVLEGPPPA
jgi:hypothetical protein